MFFVAYILERAWKSLGTISLLTRVHGKYEGMHVIDFFSVVNKMCCTRPIKILFRCQLFNLSPLFTKGQSFSLDSAVNRSSKMILPKVPLAAEPSRIHVLRNHRLSFPLDSWQVRVSQWHGEAGLPLAIKSHSGKEGSGFSQTTLEGCAPQYFLVTDCQTQKLW